MNYLKDPLWQRIDSYIPDDPDADFTFTDKLAKENNWTRHFARDAVIEYKKFMYLCCISQNGASPSHVIDQVWHLHLTYTVSYWKVFCREILQWEMHHHPSKGGQTESKKYDALYADTLTLYEDVFGAKPPVEYWDIKEKVNYPLQTFGIRPQPAYTQYMVFVIPFFITGILYNKINPYNLTGPQFLLFFLMLAIAFAFHILIRLGIKKRIIEEAIDRTPQQTDPFELAYLMGGRSMCQQMILIDLIEQDKIRDLKGSNYTIIRKHISGSQNPLNDFIQTNPEDHIGFTEIMNEAYRKAVLYDEKYPEVAMVSKRQWLDYLPAILILLTGLIKEGTCRQ